MKKWLTSGDASFSGLPIVDQNGLQLAYQEAFHPDEDCNSSQRGLKQMVFSLFCRHRSHSKRLLKFDSIAEFVEVRRIVVPVKCSGCSRRLPADTVPRFSKADPDIYVAREFRSCRSLNCKTSRGYAIPQDVALPWVRPVKRALQRLISYQDFSSTPSENQDTPFNIDDKLQCPKQINKPESEAKTTACAISLDNTQNRTIQILPPNPFHLVPADASLKHTSQSKLQYIMVPADPVVILRKCEFCEVLYKPDTAPRFWAKDSRLYVSRQAQCHSEVCKGKKRWQIPQEQSFGWIRGSLEYLSADSNTTGQLRAGITNHLLTAKDTPVKLQKPVRTKCNHCGMNGKVEARPRWTRDTPPAFYALGRRCPSKLCKNKKRTFIPIDLCIPYVNGKSLWAR
jgi:hypothetical protein